MQPIQHLRCRHFAYPPSLNKKKGWASPASPASACRFILLAMHFLRALGLGFLLTSLAVAAPVLHERDDDASSSVQTCTLGLYRNPSGTACWPGEQREIRLLWQQFGADASRYAGAFDAVPKGRERIAAADAVQSWLHAQRCPVCAATLNALWVTPENPANDQCVCKTGYQWQDATHSACIKSS
ncbi:uncharacterized protein BJ171DRAFT_571615 [Polychytrium aggregatum]|uniref:uncharacterized protein n=1 Tax=Polychytrium aggregatum TaxID=110093 RepID=UPI0022FF37AF|nr:uncharacterized protein BJ171DRAFT_571615 [Polychytrium aggregatum]KAI9193584.1 hypothetical protein BJ171DRAFT_571615 [Polychytrium aggregatum]